MLAASWASPLIVDGKVYIGDEDGDITIFRLSQDKEILGEVNMEQCRLHDADRGQQRALYCQSQSPVCHPGRCHGKAHQHQKYGIAECQWKVTHNDRTLTALAAGSGGSQSIGRRSNAFVCRSKSGYFPAFPGKSSATAL